MVGRRNLIRLDSFISNLEKGKEVWAMDLEEILGLSGEERGQRGGWGKERGFLCVA